MARVSVIIPNWNGAAYLPTCLNSLRAQSYGDFELVVVDNASRDDSVQLLERDYPEVRIIPLSHNAFFSGAVNEGIRSSQGEIVILLNNDTEADPEWLSSLVEALDQQAQAGMATSKLLLFRKRDTIHSAGDFYGIDGVPGNRGVWEKDNGRFDACEEVFGACAGAAAYRRSMLEDIGLFDEDFQAYCEDVDLSFRAQLAGYRCIYVPEARIYHHLSASGGGPLASFFCGRNFIYVAVKNMPAFLWRKNWKRILKAQLSFFYQSLSHFREPAARARLRGQFAALFHLPSLLRKRRHIQGMKVVTDEYLESILTQERPE